MTKLTRYMTLQIQIKLTIFGKTLLVLLGLLVAGMASGQKSHWQIEKEREERCPEGQYAGAYEGARSFYQDPYVWFASREFASRFCMPESYIDESLKGALALAVRIKGEEFTLCGFMGGPDQCPKRNALLIDVYIDNRKVKMPKADPSVRYFSGEIENSGYLMGVGIPRMKRRRNGEITELEGERRPFSPIATNEINEKDWVKIMYVAERKGWASKEGVFIERFYRENWIEGVDLMTIDGYLFGYGRSRNPDAKPDPKDPYVHEPVKKFAIAFMRAKDEAPYGNAWEANDYYRANTKYPDDYLYVIELPHKVSQIIYAFDRQEGQQFIEGVKQFFKSN